LFICAKDLFVEAIAQHTWAEVYQAQHSKAVARRLTAMPEVLPVLGLRGFRKCAR
jgi:hypothetical protein